MSTGAIIGLLVAIVAICAIAFVVSQELRRAKLRRQFEPEHKRLTSELGSSRKADAELIARQRRAAKLDIRQLPAEQRARYGAEWTRIQEQFVDSPAGSVTSARRLVARIMRETGYPDNNDEAIMAISVHNAGALDDYRQAQLVGDKASTEQLREAMLRYRTLFDDLAGEQRGKGTSRAAQLPRRPKALTASTRQES
jgi:hypothetical protein